MKVYIGIDWSKEKHDAIFMNEAGTAILYIRIAHMQAGFLELDAARQKLGVKPSECIVGIETSYNLIIDALWNWGYEQVYVLPPSAVMPVRAAEPPWPRSTRPIASMQQISAMLKQS